MTCSRHTLSVEWTRWTVAASLPYQPSTDRTAVEAEMSNESAHQRALSTARKLWRKSESQSLTFALNRLDNRSCFSSFQSLRERRGDGFAIRERHSQIKDSEWRSTGHFLQPLSPSSLSPAIDSWTWNRKLNAFLSNFLLARTTARPDGSFNLKSGAHRVHSW